MNTKQRYHMYRNAHGHSPIGSWILTHTYLFMVICALVGFLIGFLFTGSLIGLFQ